MPTLMGCAGLKTRPSRARAPLSLKREIVVYSFARSIANGIFYVQLSASWQSISASRSGGRD